MADSIKYEDLKVIDVKSKAFDYGISKPETPAFISNNLKHNFFDWQKSAFENFLTYQVIKERENPNKPTHLMFNMATGMYQVCLTTSNK